MVLMSKLQGHKGGAYYIPIANGNIDIVNLLKADGASL